MPGAASARLVVAGGYDKRLAENREHFQEMQQLVSDLHLDGQVGNCCTNALICTTLKEDKAHCMHSNASRQSKYLSDMCRIAGQNQHFVHNIKSSFHIRLHQSHVIISVNMAASYLAATVHVSEHRYFAQVWLLPSFTNEQRSALLAACTAVVYTPQNEHFGMLS